MCYRQNFWIDRRAHRHFVSRLFLMAAVCLHLLPRTVRADEFDDLIDKLVEVAEPGFGYARTFSGSDFLPYDGTEQFGTLILGATQRNRSENMKSLVVRGVDAVPALIRHIGDDRKTKMESFSAGGMMWMEFSDEYDFNLRTRTEAPTGVNRDVPPDEEQPDSHSVTVGDLCFVALGQIVNRNFSATRYQPTGGTIVSSPTHSKTLRDVIVKDWSELTRTQHNDLLVQDFRRPDHEGRRIGAYLRLTFYYPDAVESLVIDELKKPTAGNFDAETFCHEVLYKASGETERKRLFDDFVRKHGETATEVVREQLFDDLERVEEEELERKEMEEEGVDPTLEESETHCRQVLVQLYKMPAGIKSSDRPGRDFADDFERARFIEALTHDESHRVGEIVKDVFLKNTSDNYLAPACLTCLANRGFPEFLIEQLQQIDPRPTKTNYLQLKYIAAIGTSTNPAVRQQLVELLKSTSDDSYFAAAAKGAGDVDKELFLKWATKLLDNLPDETQQGRGVLTMVRDGYPMEAKSVLQRFLKSNNPQRVETVCRVLWYGHPLSTEVLAPYLDDQRSLAGFSIPMRVCDRAAEAMSPAAGIRYDSEWSEKDKDEAIGKLKEYCRQKSH